VKTIFVISDASNVLRNWDNTVATKLLRWLQ